ncbi:MAG: efflux RND transporter periplasmic adaptor subunit, partial [Acidobacteriota bacterium]
MKGKFFIFLILGIVIGGGGVYFFGPKAEVTGAMTNQTEPQLYSCGMHPEVVSEEPGDCPICGMKLTPIRKNNQSAPAEKEKQSRKILYWRAPMDPTEIYDKPGKSKMGMDLVPVYEGEEAGGAGSILIDGAVQQNMNLQLGSVVRRDISRIIRAFGKVTYAQDNQYSVNTKVSGWIEKLHVNNEGQMVKRGDSLLEIYSPELVSTQDEYLLALNNLKQTEDSPYRSIRQNAEKMADLARKRLEYWDIPETEIERIENRGKIRRTLVLKSPVNGIVTHKAVVEGDRVEPGMNLFHLADLSKIWVGA